MCNTHPFFFLVDGELGLTSRLQGLTEATCAMQLRFNFCDLCKPEIDLMLRHYHKRFSLTVEI